MRLWTETDWNWMSKMFKDARTLPVGNSLTIGVFAFGVMVTGLLVQMVITQGCTCIGYKE